MYYKKKKKKIDWFHNFFLSIFSINTKQIFLDADINTTKL